MTTTAAPLLPPPAIPASALDPLLDDRERACEIRVRVLFTIVECTNAADWVMSGRCNTCERRQTKLACDDCKRGMTEHGPGRVGCIHCDTDVVLTRIEALR